MGNFPKSLLPPIILGVTGVVVLIVLGSWQFGRMGWKEALLADIRERIAAEPVELPRKVDPEKDDLLRVRLVGYPDLDEIHVIHSIKKKGPGFRVIVPFELGERTKQPGRRVLVDLGFVPEAQKDIARRPGGAEVRQRRLTETKEVIGLLRWPDEIDDYTPPPDERRNIWFARSVPMMATVLDTDPVLVVAQSHPEQGWITPLPPGANIPNRHMEYALTWFGLAIVWAGMGIYWLRQEIIKLDR